MIYINQTLARVEVDIENSDINLDNVDSMDILVEKPNGNTDTWHVTQKTGTKFIYKFQTGDISVVGDYKLQARVDDNGDIGYGRIVKLKIYKPIIE